ncbi:hypothetical protein FQR65_LT11219 [Abscondita terminalis]|nr:hypothetical protein FQR65_LT11219 [Abscondita terminalis]
MSESVQPIVLLDDGELIEQVRAFSLIYDKRHKLHKDVSAVQDAWESIASILSSSPAECQRRWQILRARYNAEAKKMACTLSGSSADDYVVTWVYFKDMLFLKEYIQQRRTKSNMKPKETSSHWDPLSIIVNQDEDGVLSSNSELMTPDINMGTSESEKDLHNTSTPNIRKKKGDEELTSSLSKALTSFDKYIEVQTLNKTSLPVMDADDSFGQMVALELKLIKDVNIKKQMKKKFECII